MVNGSGYVGLEGMGGLFKTRGTGLRFSKKRQYTKRKYVRSDNFTRKAKADRKAANQAKRTERFNARMNAKLLEPPKRRGRPRGSKNKPKRSAAEMDAASALLGLGAPVVLPAGGRGRGRPKLPAISGPFS